MQFHFVLGPIAPVNHISLIHRLYIPFSGNFIERPQCDLVGLVVPYLYRITASSVKILGVASRPLSALAHSSASAFTLIYVWYDLYCEFSPVTPALYVGLFGLGVTALQSSCIHVICSPWLVLSVPMHYLSIPARLFSVFLVSLFSSV